VWLPDDDTAGGDFFGFGGFCGLAQGEAHEIGVEFGCQHGGIVGRPTADVKAGFTPPAFAFAPSRILV
jgi:hypothetical protein